MYCVKKQYDITHDTTECEKCSKVKNTVKYVRKIKGNKLRERIRKKSIELLY